jgi:hypothetical protein
MNDTTLDVDLRLMAAVKAAPYVHRKNDAPHDGQPRLLGRVGRCVGLARQMPSMPQQARMPATYQFVQRLRIAVLAAEEQ